MLGKGKMVVYWEIGGDKIITLVWGLVKKGCFLFY